MNSPVVDYRLPPALVLRAAGGALVLLALVVLVLSLVAAASGWPFWPVALVALAGASGIALGGWWAARAAYVVRLDRRGYRVRLVRGAGVKQARWADVAEASTAEVRGLACVLLSLRDGRTTTVPMAVLAGDRDEFVTRVRTLLREAH